MVRSQAAMSFINCQALKRASNKSKWSGCKAVAKYKTVSKIMFQSHQAAMSFINCQNIKEFSKKYFQKFDIFKSYGV